MIFARGSFQRPTEGRALRCALALVLALSAIAAAQQPDTQPPVAQPPASQPPPAQQSGGDGAASPAPDSGGVPATPAPTQEAPPDKRIFGVLPNYRTANSDVPFQPLTAEQKFGIAAKDSFDWPIIPLSGAFAGLYQLDGSNPSFGQGVKGYAKRFAAAYGDQAIGNMMTEGLWPALLHDDPRYFRRGTGSKKSRAWYAATRIFVTRRDNGSWRFNYAEVIGNSVATAISNAYYPESRDVKDNVVKLATQLGTDSFSQVLKEFWPDIKRKLFHRHG